MKNNHLPDSPFFRFMDVVGDVFLLNLCWVIGCLPLITVGASTTAAFAVAGKMAAGQDYRVFADYLAAFRRDFGTATRTWLGMAVLGLLFWVDYRLGLAWSGSVGGVLISAAAALGVMWTCTAGCGFALLGRFFLPLRSGRHEGRRPPLPGLPSGRSALAGADGHAAGAVRCGAPAVLVSLPLVAAHRRRHSHCAYRTAAAPCV